MSPNRCSKVLQTSVHKVELDSIHNYYKPSLLSLIILLIWLVSAYLTCVHP